MSPHNYYPVTAPSSSSPTPAGVSPSQSPSINHWTHPGPASADFRSDTITTPTASMLAAIASTTLGDDVFLEDPTTNALQAWIADMLGKPAALLVMSGTMGNQVAIRTHLQGPPHSVLCDHRAHILRAEAGGVAALCGAQLEGVFPANGSYLTLEDVQAHAVLSDDIHGCPTKLIELENTLGGNVMPLAEMQRIGAWAREHGIITHLDGARLWEAVAAGHGTLREYAACVDSIQLCFSKGLGAPMGSIIVGTDAFVTRARWIRKSIGGGIRMAGVVSSAARNAVEEQFLGGRLLRTHEQARRLADKWQGLGGVLSVPTETNMVWLDVKKSGVKAEDIVTLAAEKGIKTFGTRIVVHYQISEMAMQGLEEVMEEVMRNKKAAAPATNGTAAA
ncbi:L-allo-threonine aldolase protein [Lasiodiplodia theobromae]|uniref:Aldolase vrtJ n=1 Tax=Lasiodiplodia theobromae TaxID=45133 RepID=A0A5N5D9K8_9PEZI|nr:L-allo-threonine aldolase protein [Lasiodiplodia theobromae]KAB2574516.1 Aldolase vrtJ [Lasiodiplodia theobromae]KAF4536969.1 L-allo-threonine aldolase protein [Lasiodiplodia theobromae]